MYRMLYGKGISHEDFWLSEKDAWSHPILTKFYWEDILSAVEHKSVVISYI